MSTAKIVAACAFAAGLAACGTTQGDRALSGAMVGAGTGVVVGPIGAGVGAVAGAVTGYVTDRDDVYLGRPVWKTNHK